MEKVILVNTLDIPIGEMEKIEAHKKAILHRAVSVFIFNSNQQLLLQKRAFTKYHSPGLWTNTACTHPYPNEENESAAYRRLLEEMGLKVNKLTKAFDFIYKEELENDLTEYEFDHVYIGYSDEIPQYSRVEVCDFKYLNMEDILEDIKNSPEKYTVWFRKIALRVNDFVKQK